MTMMDYLNMYTIMYVRQSSYNWIHAPLSLLLSCQRLPPPYMLTLMFCIQLWQSKGLGWGLHEPRHCKNKILGKNSLVSYISCWHPALDSWCLGDVTMRLGSPGRQKATWLGFWRRQNIMACFATFHMSL